MPKSVLPGLRTSPGWLQMESRVEAREPGETRPTMVVNSEQQVTLKSMARQNFA